MAEKKYTQFSEGNYDPDRVLLTADPVTGQLSKVDLSTLLGYNFLFEAINQQGTSAPTSIIRITSISNSITWARLSQGSYSCTSNGNFPANKTIIASMMNYLDLGVVLPIFDFSSIIGYYSFYRQNDNALRLDVFDAAFNFADLSDLGFDSDDILFIPSVYIKK